MISILIVEVSILYLNRPRPHVAETISTYAKALATAYEGAWGVIFVTRGKNTERTRSQLPTFFRELALHETYFRDVDPELI